MSDAGIEALIGAFYSAFDNCDGRVPDGDALLAMFADGATITRVSRDSAERWSPQEFAAPRIAMLTDGTLTGFHEWEVDAQTVVLDNIASRSSAYEKDGVLNGSAYRGAGRKFIQLLRTGDGWKISAILWEDA